jgi:hypothetical protein
MITTLDEQYTILNDKQFDDETVSKIGENTIILASEITNENILKKFNQDNLFLYEVFIPFHKNNLIFDGYSIGEVTLAMLIKMNPKEIYLIGLDLALNQKTGDSHFRQSNSGVSKLNLKEKQNREYFEQRKSLIKVKGNFKKEVFTTPLFYTSIKSTESKIFFKNKDTNIFNLSTHGAYFFATKPKKIKNIKINEIADSNYSNEVLKNFLIKNSSKKLSIQSKKRLNKDMIFIEELNKILEEMEIKDFRTYDNFLKKIYSIAEKMMDKKIFIFYQVINNYLEIVVPYLSYHFNDKEIKNQAKEIRKIKNIFINDIKKMTKDYKTCLERIL